jgi:hypothetical protein
LEKNHFGHSSKKELLSDRLSQQIVNAKSEDFYRHYGVACIFLLRFFFLVNDPMALIGLLAASRFVFVFVSSVKNVVHYYYYYSLAG